MTHCGELRQKTQHFNSWDHCASRLTKVLLSGVCGWTRWFVRSRSSSRLSFWVLHKHEDVVVGPQLSNEQVMCVRACMHA